MELLLAFGLGALVGVAAAIDPIWHLTIYDGGWFPNGFRFVRVR